MMMMMMIDDDDDDDDDYDDDDVDDVKSLSHLQERSGSVSNTQPHVLHY